MTITHLQLQHYSVELQYMIYKNASRGEGNLSKTALFPVVNLWSYICSAETFSYLEDFFIFYLREAADK